MTRWILRPEGPEDAGAWDALLARTGRRTERPPEARRWVAQGPDGALLGGLQLDTRGFAPPGWQRAHVAVDPGWRGQGLGQALWDLGREVSGGTGLSAEVDLGDDPSLAWAERRGFALHARRFFSALDLATFDPAPHAGAGHALGQAGIQILDLMATPTPEGRGACLALAAEGLSQTPDLRDQPPFDAERASAHLGWDALRPDWVVFAQGPSGEYLGLSVLVIRQGAARNALTYVRPQARGLGLARALKLAVIRRAQAAGLSRMTTLNHSANAPMLAVNRRLGFVAESGRSELRRAPGGAG